MEKFKPLDTFFNVIKGKGKAPIVILVGRKPRRYSQLHRRFSSLSERILIKQLKELEQDGIIIKKTFGEKPPLQVEYHISEYGQSLCKIIEHMWYWGEAHLEKTLTTT